MNRSLLFFLLGVILFTSCGQNETTADDQDGLSAFSADSLGKHIAHLSSDDFTGRKPFSEGETKTINYLKEQVENAGHDEKNIQYCLKFSNNLLEGINYYISAEIGNENSSFLTDLKKAISQINILVKHFEVEEELT